MKNGHNMVKSLKQGKLNDIKAEEPQRTMSTETDPVKKAQEQKLFHIKYEAELNRYMERKDFLTANVSQMFAVIGQKVCTRTMLARIEEHPEYKIKIEDDPFEMPEVIKSLMHDPVRSQYFFATATNAMMRTVNTKQGPQEPTIDYTKRFKQDWDVLRSFLETKCSTI